MLDELTDQLRRYGEAVERAVLDAEFDADDRVAGRWWTRHRLLAAAAVCLALLAGGATVAALARDEARTVVDSTGHGTPRPDRGRADSPVPDTRPSPAGVPTTIANGGTPTSAPVPAATGSTTLPGARAQLPSAPALSQPSPTSSPGLSPTTTVAAPTNAVRGHASWLGTRDARGFLRVAACPLSDTSMNCPSVRTASVAPDGSFTLPLPAGSGEWRVAAYVGVNNFGCIFQCEWRGTQIGPSTNVFAAQPPHDLRLSVTARVVGVVVRDRDGNPFPQAGMMVFDQRCASNCDGTDLAGMFMGAHDDLGDITLVVDPAVTYSFGGYASGQGWPNPYVMNGVEMWFSDAVVTKGSDLAEGTMFRINGGPNG